jgi:hypothetical protein
VPATPARTPTTTTAAMRVILEEDAPPTPPEVWTWILHRPWAFFAWAALALAGAAALLAVRRRVARRTRRSVYMPPSARRR